jgi:hypothetical protein
MANRYEYNRETSVGYMYDNEENEVISEDIAVKRLNDLEKKIKDFERLCKSIIKEWDVDSQLTSEGLYRRNDIELTWLSLIKLKQYLESDSD